MLNFKIKGNFTDILLTFYENLCIIYTYIVFDLISKIRKYLHKLSLKGLEKEWKSRMNLVAILPTMKLSKR